MRVRVHDLYSMCALICYVCTFTTHNIANTIIANEFKEIASACKTENKRKTQLREKNEYGGQSYSVVTASRNKH